MASPPTQADSGDKDHIYSNEVPNDGSTSSTTARGKIDRKRTKTGCLTCRKRRIKCGEERPVCKNCVKSKRHCDGYTQRVRFQPPTFEFRPGPHGGAHITFQAGPVGPVQHHHTWEQHTGSADYTGLRPRPFDVSASQPPAPMHHFSFVPQSPLITDTSLPTTRVLQPPFEGLPLNTPTFVYPTSQFPPPIQVPASAPQPHPSPEQLYTWVTQTSPTSLHVLATPPDTSPSSTDGLRNNSVVNEHFAFGHSSHVSDHFGSIDLGTTGATAVGIQPPVEGDWWSFAPALELISPMNPTHFLSQAAVETQDDEYFDVLPDDDLSSAHQGTPTYCEQDHSLSRILELNSISIQDSPLQRYDTFLYPGVLDTYRAERVANPLKNPLTARVFAHFVSSTGPTLSIFERHQKDPSVLFSSRPIPFSEQGLWTYTMPKVALHHQGLLHAMLALASLHIAKLTGAARTPSVQHYAWALKRVHHAVGHPKKRLTTGTIAASMLLGYYEIIAADHMKWNMHLAGSKQLYLETDFPDMAKQFTLMKLERAMDLHTGINSVSDADPKQNELLDQIPAIDNHVVSLLVGRMVRYDSHGQIVQPGPQIPKPLDLSKFEALKDLFWWYCKQDAYQSLIGGLPLLLDYSRWANCPPRAPIGQVNAVYGSSDHLMLLLGRVADFAARDRNRKLRQVKANGGHWKRHKDMKMERPAGTTPMVPPTPSKFQPPAFYGMAPPPSEATRMPVSYQNTAFTEPTPEPQPTNDLALALDLALQEHAQIRAALTEFAHRLGPDFAPISTDQLPPTPTAFGPALHYRTPNISCLWALYNMTLIVAIRSHPHMPPAAHMAAGVAAAETAPYANDIGRIAEGLVPHDWYLLSSPVSPILGVALNETCMPSFFAGIQYRDATQRDATVRRIFSVGQRTGWGSAELIANGCETAWVKAYEAGRGPMYVRTGRQGQSDDPRLNGSWERLDPMAPADERDDGDRRLVHLSPHARLNWAIGVMGTEEDVRMRG